MMKHSLVLVVFVILFTAVTTSASEPEPTSTKNGAAWLHAIRAGVLMHDVDDLWSGTSKEGGVDIAPTSRKHVPASVLKEVAKIKKMIIDGKLKVPTNQKDYDRFVKGL